jgi:hypothetical protein
MKFSQRQKDASSCRSWLRVLTDEISPDRSHGLHWSQEKKRTSLVAQMLSCTDCTLSFFIATESDSFLKKTILGHHASSHIQFGDVRKDRPYCFVFGVCSDPCSHHCGRWCVFVLVFVICSFMPESGSPSCWCCRTSRSSQKVFVK